MTGALSRSTMRVTLCMLIFICLSRAASTRSLEVRLGDIDVSANPLLQLKMRYGSGVWRDPRVHNYRDPRGEVVLLAMRLGLELRYADADDQAIFRGYGNSEAVIATLSTWRTTRRIGLNSTQAAVVDAYGKPEEVTMMGPSAKLMVYKKGDWELRFTVVDSRVKGLLIQRFPPYPSHY